MKYIDAEKLIEILEEKKKAEYENCGGVNSKTGVLQEVQELITSLQQEQIVPLKNKFVFPKFLYARTINNKTIDVSYAPQSLDAVEYTRSDSLQQEQPEVGLEKEVEKKWNSFEIIDEGMGSEYINIGIEQFDEICRHFYELGINTRNEE